MWLNFSQAFPFLRKFAYYRCQQFCNNGVKMFSLTILSEANYRMVEKIFLSRKERPFLEIFKFHKDDFVLKVLLETRHCHAQD